MSVSFARALLCLTLVLPGFACAEAPVHSGYRLLEAFPDIKFHLPVAAVVPPDESGRIFVLEKNKGVIKVIARANSSGPAVSDFFALLPRPGTSGLAGSNEQGLLGLAFHPDYRNSGHFFVCYTPKREDGKQTNRLSRFTDTAITGESREIGSTEVILIDQVDRWGNHNGGDLHFGPDGYLYISVGDEGAGNDKGSNSQRIDKNFFAGILRIDVDQRPGSRPPNPHPASIPNTYTVPADNPFVGAILFNGKPVDPGTVRTEFWAVGLRNVWRFHFDSSTGEIYAGDVGQNAYEEINLIRKGGNYGWAYREGKHKGPKKGDVPSDLIDPIWEYPRSEGISVTGGIVYRGERLPKLQGAYIFADFGKGNIWALHTDANGKRSVELLAKEDQIASFGTDPHNGDPLLVDLDGRIWRLVEEGVN